MHPPARPPACSIAPLMTAHFALSILQIVPSIRQHFTALRQVAGSGRDVVGRTRKHCGRHAVHAVQWETALARACRAQPASRLAAGGVALDPSPALHTPTADKGTAKQDAHIVGANIPPSAWLPFCACHPLQRGGHEGAGSLQLLHHRHLFLLCSVGGAPAVPAAPAVLLPCAALNGKPRWKTSVCWFEGAKSACVCMSTLTAPPSYLQAYSLARQWAPYLAAKAAAAAGDAAATAASAAASAAASGASGGGAGFVAWAVLILTAGAVVCKTICQTVEQRGWVPFHRKLLRVLRGVLVHSCNTTVPACTGGRAVCNLWCLLTLPPCPCCPVAAGWATARAC